VSNITIKILRLENCRGATLTTKLVRRLASELGIPIVLHEVLVTSLDQARELRVFGSPTVQINGRDIDPAVRALQNFGLG